MKKPGEFHYKAVELIRARMREKNISNPQLAKKLGLAPTSVFNMLEHGKTISIERLKAISVQLDYNFFKHLSEDLDLSEPGRREFPEQKRLEELEIENRLLIKLLRP